VTRFAPVYRALGMIIMLFGLTMLAPLILSYVTEDGAQTAYDEAFALTMLCGAFLWYRYRKCKRDLNIRDGFLMVVLVWTVLPAFAAVPLMIHLGISHTDAYFETMSGLTTTGSTVLSNIDLLPMSINLWRHLLVWVGGMGLIVLAIAILPLLGIGGRQMFKAETPGPMKDAKMTPRIAETAKGLWLVYLGVTVACILGFRWAGMTWFDAFCHAFSTMGLGGFSTHDASFGHFNSPAIEAVAIVFMLIAGMNFGTLFMAVSGRSLRPYIHDPEARWFIGITLLSIFVVATYIWKLPVTQAFTCAAGSGIWGFPKTVEDTPAMNKSRMPSASDWLSANAISVAVKIKPLAIITAPCRLTWVIAASPKAPTSAPPPAADSSSP